MLSDNEVIERISAEFPELNDVAITPNQTKHCTFINKFSTYSSGLIVQEDWDKLKDCFGRIYKIHRQSSDRIKAFIENIFLYNLGTIANASGNREKLLGLMPKGMRQILLQQFIASNI